MRWGLRKLPLIEWYSWIKGQSLRNRTLRTSSKSHVPNARICFSHAFWCTKMNNLTSPSLDDVFEARRVLDGIAVRTPLLRSDKLDQLTGAKIFIKCENLQRTGAFKFRGAYNCLSRLNREAYPSGVVAYSTGNHGQAVATVGRMLGIHATIVMPDDAPAIKVIKAR